MNSLQQAILRVCNADPGSNLPKARDEVCAAIEQLRREFAPPQASPGVWKEENAPKDGTHIVAIGHVVYEEGESFDPSEEPGIPGSMHSQPFLARVCWVKDSSGYEGWHLSESGLTVARTLDDEVIIDFWTEVPE